MHLYFLSFHNIKESHYLVWLIWDRAAFLSLEPAKVFCLFHIKDFCFDTVVFGFLNADADLTPDSGFYFCFIQIQTKLIVIQFELEYQTENPLHKRVLLNPKSDRVLLVCMSRGKSPLIRGC